MKAAIILFTLFSGITSFKTDRKSIKINWVEKLSGNFSFAKKQTISCKAWSYEWAGTNSIAATRISKDTTHCYTAMNEATHCSLDLIIANGSCSPTIVLKSIVPRGSKVYYHKGGYIKIDKALWKQNILKADFDFNFENDEKTTRTCFGKERFIPE